MSVKIKLDNGILIDCIVFDEQGVEEDDSVSLQNELVVPDRLEKEFQFETDYEEKSNDISFIKPLDSDDKKFGEIFLSNKHAKLYFICSFCSKEYYKIQNFVKHCVEDHDIDSWNVFKFLQAENLLQDNENPLRGKKITDHDYTCDNNAFVDKLPEKDPSNKIYESLESLNVIDDSDWKCDPDLDEQCKEFAELSCDYESKLDDNNYAQTSNNNDIIDNKHLMEDSDDNTDFEDPPDLNKIKSCRHCSTKVVNFKLHMRIKHLDLLYKCKIRCCHELFLTEKRLKEHAAVVHRDPEKPFACKNCEYKTKKKGSLDTHFKRMHLNIRNKKCSFCGKNFYDTGELRKHERMHTGERPAMCYICGKGLRTTQDLNKHILRDHGEPTFCCKVCGKKFHLKETLLKHNIVHSNERPHICHVCGKGFKHVKYLRGHMDLHSGVKKYECKVCGKKFAQKNNYTGHQKIHNKSNLEVKGS